MNIKTKLIILNIALGFTLSVSVCFAQEPPSSDSTARATNLGIDELTRLKKQETLTLRSIDSLSSLLDTQRKLYSTQPSDSVGEKIISLESSVFDLRSQLSLLGSEISTLQAKQSMNSIENQTNDASSDLNSSNIFDSEFFAENITPQVLSYLRSAHDISSEFEANLSRVTSLHDSIEALGERYQATTVQSVVDSIIIRSAQLRGQIMALDSELSRNWQELYRTKLDHYLILTDKLEITDRDMLERLDMLSRGAFNASVSEGESSMAPSIEAYKPQRQHVLEYELLFAERLALNAAADSLKAVQKSISSKEFKMFNDIHYKYRSITTYSDITLGNTYSYSDIAEVPLVKIPEKGVYYAIQVALITRPASSLSIFKGAEPLQLERTATGGYRYILGGFASYDNAQAALSQCKGAQFRNPVLVAWVDGKFTSVANAKAYQAKNPQFDPSKQGYAIRVVSSNSQIAAQIKTILDSSAEGDKSIARAQNGSNVIFTISSFPTSDQARVIAHVLQSELGQDVQLETFDIGKIENEQ